MVKIEQLLSIIYPPTCGICGKINKNFLCKKCEITLKKYLKNVILTDEDELMYVFKYENLIREMIIKFKFKNQPYICKTFMTFLINNKNIFEFIKKYDTIIPVPISNKRKKERGYNQSFLMAKEIAKYINKSEKNTLKLMHNNLIKTKDIIEQSKLNEESRKENIKGVYKIINKEIIKNKKILLIDDIYTTGSTINECKKTLKKGNPKKIGILVLAKD